MLKIKPAFVVFSMLSMLLFEPQSVFAETIASSQCNETNNPEISYSWGSDKPPAEFDIFFKRLTIKPITESEYEAAKPLPGWFDPVAVQGYADGYLELPLENGKKLAFDNKRGGVDSDTSHYLVGIYNPLNAYVFEHSVLENIFFPLYSKLDGKLLVKFGNATVKHPDLPLFFSFTGDYLVGSSTDFEVFRLDHKNKFHKIFVGSINRAHVQASYSDRPPQIEDQIYSQNYQIHQDSSKEPWRNHEIDWTKNPTIFIDAKGVIYLTYHNIGKDENEIQFDTICYLKITYDTEIKH